MFSMRSLGAICYNLYSLFKEADSEALVPDAAVVGTVSRLGSTSVVLGSGPPEVWTEFLTLACRLAV